jgi:putative ABC transport system substrate-binding protein
VLHDIAPRVRRVGFMFNPATAPRAGFVRNIETDAASLGMQPLAAEVRDPAEIGQAIGDLGRNGDGGLVILPDVFNTTHRGTIIADTARHRVPAIYSLRFFVLAGGLISYGIDNIDVYRRAASYIDRILNGAQPGELPVQLPSTFECAVNLTTLKALGLAVTPKLNVMANEMIE